MAEEKISVRNLVEFILRQGDLDNREGSTDVDAMKKGSTLHKKIQKRQDSTYWPEVSLKMEIPLAYGEEVIRLKLEGRADGIQELAPVNGCRRVLVDEIKTVKKDLQKMEAPNPVHVAQAKCYAYMYGREEDVASGILRLTYCHQDTEEIRYFEEPYELSSLELWFERLVKEYSKWVFWKRNWVKTRNESIKKVEFPFEYRPGQKELAVGVYRTILRKKKLYLEAPTGVGKTLSTVFPAVKAMGEEICEKIFYLTAKTIARGVASDTFSLLEEQGLLMKVLTITAKEKICILDKPDCNPVACVRAKGHFDRINDAVFALLTSDEMLTRETVVRYSQKFQVCPFELSLDAALWCDAIICDYNYVFDPNVVLKRFFDGGGIHDYVFLIDEAHNLVERAREMYSAVLVKEQFLKVRHIVKGSWDRLEKRLGACNNILLKYKRECDEMLVVDDVHELAFQLLRLSQVYDEFMEARPDYETEQMNEILNLYFDLKRFLAVYELLDDKYEILFQFQENGAFQVKLQCMDPSENLKKCLSKGRSAVFFSATLLPVSYYRQQLAGEEEDYAIYAPSPFPKENRRVFLAKGVSTVYKRRTKQEYMRILSYIQAFVTAKSGNYLVFFPSYRMMQEVLELLEEPGFQSFYEKAEIYEQKPGMTEQEKEEFLSLFSDDEKMVLSKVGMCVLGGVFGEGIDLTGDRLIGAAIVGTGLPMVGPERELFRNYYDEKKQMGFEYAYLYPGMNKVMQAAGRVIRTMEDKGAVLLLDERFQYSQYQNLFPREWFPCESVSLEEMKEKLEAFWNE